MHDVSVADVIPGPPADRLRAQLTELAAIHRPSASAGERQAAEWVAERLREQGATAQVETERVHGDYWSPLALLSMAGAMGAVLARRRRLAGATLSALAAAGVWDDITGGRHHVRRALPRRETFNVVAEMGPADARRTVVLVAHHDAAKSGLIFHPGIPAFVWRRFPSLIEGSDTSPPLMWPVFAGPALAAARRARRQSRAASRWSGRVAPARPPCSRRSARRGPSRVQTTTAPASSR